MTQDIFSNLWNFSVSVTTNRVILVHVSSEQDFLSTQCRGITRPLKSMVSNGVHQRLDHALHDQLVGEVPHPRAQMKREPTVRYQQLHPFAAHAVEGRLSTGLLDPATGRVELMKIEFVIRARHKPDRAAKI